MPAINGWTGKVLLVDLSSRSCSIITPDEKIYRQYLGGKGLAAWFMRRYCTLDWNDADTPLLFFTGPLAGTSSPMSSRFTVMSISPLTGTLFDSSAGGSFGIDLKRAGFDGIIITGGSRSLTGISISGESVEFTDASQLERKSVSATFASLPPEGSAAVAGYAAENGVLFANIAFTGHSFAGRGGLGLVMASKGLKYIHVRGDSELSVYDSKGFAEAERSIIRQISASPALAGELGISEYGTGAFYDLIRSRRMMPALNFGATYFPGSEHMNAWHYRKKFGMNKTGCFGCHIQCKKTSDDGWYLPEYDTMSHFSALVGNSSIDDVVAAAALCDDAGIDTISAASTIACYIEINNPGNGSYSVAEILNDIVHSRGEGEMLKCGSFRYAESSGNRDASISVKRLELPAYDPRGAYSTALAYALSTRGGCHLAAYPVSHEILRKPVATDRFTFGGKSRIIKLAEDANAAMDSLSVCRFASIASSLEEYSAVLRAVTGTRLNAAEIAEAGERVFYLIRMMNALRGFSSADDDLPARFFLEPGSSGDGISIPPINRDAFLEARVKYYKIRGLSPDGLPLKERCEELGIEW